MWIIWRLTDIEQEEGVSIIYCCITNLPIFGGLKQQSLYLHSQVVLLLVLPEVCLETHQGQAGLRWHPGHVWQADAGLPLGYLSRTGQLSLLHMAAASQRERITTWTLNSELPWQQSELKGQSRVKLWGNRLYHLMEEQQRLCGHFNLPQERKGMTTSVCRELLCAGHWQHSICILISVPNNLGM